MHSMVCSCSRKVVLVAGSREEVWPLQKDLATVARHGRVVCMPTHTAAHHEAFVAKLLQKVGRWKPNFWIWIILQQIISTLQNPVKGMCSQNFPLPQKEALKGEDEITCSRVAEFMAYVHESYCNTPVGGTSSRAPLRSAKGSPRPAVKQLPSVAAMEDLVITFVGRLRERKEHTQKKVGSFVLMQLSIAITRIQIVF